MARNLPALTLMLLTILMVILAGCLDSAGDGEDGDDNGTGGGIDVGNQTVPDRVTMVTSIGTIIIELDEEAPKTVANFKRYIEAGFYDGLIFHRVIDGFMVQGGGFYADMTQKSPIYQPIDLEITSLRHADGVIAMARTGDPNSATSQFYITDGPQSNLDGPVGSTTQGYAVFGHVVSGMAVVRAISAVTTVGDVPTNPIYIQSVTLG